MTLSTRKSTFLATTLVTTSWLASPALAMTDLAGGYALAASQPPASGKSATPPPAEASAQAGPPPAAEHAHAEGTCGAHLPATDKKAAEKTPPPDPHTGAAAHKGMEGKCGEGKCGASL